MTTDRELMQQALEALEQCAVTIDWEWGDCRDLEEMRETGQYTAATTSAINALRERLAQPEQEPVAWNVINPAGEVVATEKDAIHGWARLGGFKPTVEGLLGFHDQGWRVVPSSTPQPQRKPLKGEDIYMICKRTLPKTVAGMSFVPEWALPLARAIEAAHGIKE